MRNFGKAFRRVALLAVAVGALTACSGGYAGYTEYRSPPVKTASEMRQEQISELRRARNTPGGAGEQRSETSPW
ncbi:hypothetical protein [Pararhizobium haloflavum]|uniref:hypothetical protein n=1 Tax=Pararhizobium haloflavum TaxID=2037914 RepID=UPI000C1945EC|nr:hypothetical protein [Pararhizobium haloflavum]